MGRTFSRATLRHTNCVIVSREAFFSHWKHAYYHYTTTFSVSHFPIHHTSVQHSSVQHFSHDLFLHSISRTAFPEHFTVQEFLQADMFLCNLVQYSNFQHNMILYICHPPPEACTVVRGEHAAPALLIAQSYRRRENAERRKQYT